MTTSTTTRKRAPRSAAVQAVPDEPATDTADESDEASDTVEFTVTFDRDGEDEDHVFSARPKFTYKRMREAATAQAKGGAAALLRFEKMIRPSLCDDDGVPAKWTPAAEKGRFVDPDGVERDLSEVAEFLDWRNGSSRRRWAYLLDDDEDVEIGIEAIAEAYNTLVDAASERPTQKSRS